MSPGQHAVHESPIEPVCETLLPRAKREASASSCAGWQQSPEQNIGAEVHVMMAIKAFGIRSVEPTVFVELGRDHILEGGRKPRVEYHLGETVLIQIATQLLLMLVKLAGSARSGERRRKVQMQTGVHTPLPSYVSSPF